MGFTTRRYGPRTIEKWSEEHPEANIGLCPGLNGLTVVDVDDAAAIGDCVHRFGNTPLKTQSPRGAFHLWYRNSGEGCHNLRPSLEVDIKGHGGLIIIPPSQHFQTKSRWTFIEGDESDLAAEKLPSIKQGAVPKFSRRTVVEEMRDGDGRNTCLFDCLRQKALYIDSEEALIMEAHSFNRQFAEPMTENEVLRVVGSILKYKREGTLLVKGCEPHSLVSRSERLALQDKPDALALLLIVRENHSARCQRGETFAISPTGMANAAKMPDSQLPSWGQKRFAKARDCLLERQFIALVKRRTRRQPNQYTLLQGRSSILPQGKQCN